MDNIFLTIFFTGTRMGEYREEFINSDFIEGDYLFFGNKPITPTTVERTAKKYMKLAKVKEIRIHDFRHSFTSMYIHLGANPNTLVKIMGHASAKETLDTYADMYPNEDIKYYNKKRIITKLKGLMPISYRHQTLNDVTLN